jgi:hypothetical protein
LSDEPPSRRTVRDFCNHYGLSRPQFLDARQKAKVKPKDWDSMLSAKDQDALLRHMSAAKRTAQVARQIWQQPTVTKQFAPPPAPEPEPEIDYEAETEAEINRMSESLDKWRTVLIELAEEHAAVDGKGRCRRCHEEAPCLTKRTATRLDNEFVEQVAVADSGDLEGPAQDAQPPLAVLQRRLSQLYGARDRCRTALTRLTIDHMLEDGKGRCTQCRVKAPCDTKRAVMRVNRGIAHEIERYASMDERELEVALGNRRWSDYDEDEDDDWDAM